MSMQEELKQIRDRQDQHEAMFSRHLEIYANNGKELAKLTETILQNNKQTQEMYEIFSGLTTTGKWSSIIAKWIFGLFIGLGSLIIMWHNITK